MFCGITTISPDPAVPDPENCNTWKDLVDATVQHLHGAANQDESSPVALCKQAEHLILQKSQIDSFPEDYALLQSGKPVTTNSRLITLSPEFDAASGLIRVGGRLRRAEELDPSAVHPVVLDPHHRVTTLLIRDFDTRLRHPGPERVFAEVRRSFWILRGREAIRKQQHSCPECRRWRSTPSAPFMADLPSARLRLFKPPFYSCGMDCFGPFQVKVGRRTEKRWGLIFKCLTTRAVHLDLLTSIDSDAFLMALRRFTARRGTPAELYSDQGTNFRGAERELATAFAEMHPNLKELLAKQHRIEFHFNPPAAPHFGGAWEREIRSVKSTLRATVGSQMVTEEVLQTVLIEVEGILNSKPLGYVSSNIADLDPITPNHLLMGRPSSSLPPVVYPQSELLSRRRWRQSQILTDHFWSRFIKYYLPSLQPRQKWQKVTDNLTVGTVVMLADPQLPRALWSIGRVVKVIPSGDGRIRAVEVKVGDRVYTRPVVRLVVLPELPEDSTAA